MSSRERTLAAIVDTFVPAAEGLPSASELGIHRRLLEEVKLLGKPALAQQMDLLLSAVDTRLGNLAVSGHPTRVTKMSPEARQRWLHGLGASPLPIRRMAFQDLKRLTLLLAYGIEDSPWRARTGFVPPIPDAPSPSKVRVRTPKAGETLDADVVVIGSGAGGGVAAGILAAAGRKVLVLERAAMVTEEGFGGPELAGLGALFLDRGLAATSDRWISIRAGSAVGGGTVVNWASSLRAPAAVREEWRAAGIGDDLDDHYTAMEQDLCVTSEESIRNGPNSRLQAGLEALGHPVHTIPRNVQGCTDCGPCAVGCRKGAKQSVLRNFLASACEQGAEILDSTEVLTVTTENGRATGVTARVPGGTITVRAPMVALAGGSILSPAVLQRSGIAPESAGHNLRMHPVAAVGGIYGESLSPWSGVPQSVMSDAFAEIDGSWGFRLEAAPTHPGLIATGFPWWEPADHREYMRRCDNVAAFLAIVRDRNSGRIALRKDGTVDIFYKPGAPERELLRQAQIEMTRIHRAAGAERTIPLVTPPLDWQRGQAFEPYLEELGRRSIAANRILLFTAHQMSSCRIGHSPKTSTANPDGQVHGVKGLYVTDASAMPTASGVNPMLSLMAIARRTATRMAAAS
ncbi:MAG: GMC family oxidoreductase N-terminal domain-containing protein [Chloroflexota bacterium]